MEDLFAGGLAARKAGRGDLGSANAPADGDRVGTGSGTCGGRTHQDHRRSFYPSHHLGIHVDLAGDFSLEAEKRQAQPTWPCHKGTVARCQARGCGKAEEESGPLGVW